jgi:hypothetical protein
MGIDGLLKDIERQVRAEARSELGGYAREAVRDGREFLQAIRDDLARWTDELAQGRLSQQEFRSLVQGAADLAEMHALRRKGVERIAINRFTDRVTEIVVDAALSLLPL